MRDVSFSDFVRDEFSRENWRYNVLFMIFVYITIGLIMVPLILGFTVSLALGIQSVIPFVNDSISSIIRTYTIIFLVIWMMWSYKKYKRHHFKNYAYIMDLEDIHQLANSESVDDMILACNLIGELGLSSPQYTTVLGNLADHDNYKIREAAISNKEKVDQWFTAVKKGEGGSIHVDITERFQFGEKSNSARLEIGVTNKSMVSPLGFTIQVDHKKYPDIVMDDKSRYRIEPQSKRVISQDLDFSPNDLPVSIFSEITTEDGVVYADNTPVHSLHFKEEIESVAEVNVVEYQLLQEYGCEIINLQVNGEKEDLSNGKGRIRRDGFGRGKLLVEYDIKTKKPKEGVKNFIKRRIIVKADLALSGFDLRYFKPDLFLRPSVYLSPSEDGYLLNVEFLNTSDIPVVVNGISVYSQNGEEVLNYKDPVEIQGQDYFNQSIKWDGDIHQKFSAKADYTIPWKKSVRSFTFLDL